MTVEQGWGIRGKDRKSHYFRDHKSVCGHGRTQASRYFPDQDPYSCKLCIRVLESEKP